MIRQSCWSFSAVMLVVHARIRCVLKVTSPGGDLSIYVTATCHLAVVLLLSFHCCALTVVLVLSLTVVLPLFHNSNV